jgi:hypothetical protein
MVGKRLQFDRKRDAIAEFARLIAQSNSHEESARFDNRFCKETLSEGYNDALELPPAPRLAVDLDEHEQACDCEHCSAAQAHEVTNQPCGAEEEYQDSEVPPYAAEGRYEDNALADARQRSLTFVMGMLGLALVGTAGAFGYYEVFGGSPLRMSGPSLAIMGNEPTEMAAASRQPQAKNIPDASQLAITGSIEKRNEQSITVETTKSATRVTSARIPTGRDSALRAGAPTAAPAADQALPKKTTRLALAAGPSDPAAKAVTPLPLGGYAVQVTSQRTESAAQAAFRRLQVKYPKQLSARHPVIRRADLGAAGIYYRAFVGHFASAEKATRWCSDLKAAGGDCVIHKN